MDRQEAGDMIIGRDKPYIRFLDDSILIEWILPESRRFGISIEYENPITESSWYFVGRDEDPASGALPEELISVLMGLGLTQTVIGQ
jgi:hypothetical protein